MIRQAISCDICGTEMLNANHWFVAYDRGPELCIAPWSSSKRVKPSTRHLCGHKCLHKLVDDFMAESSRCQPSTSAVAKISIEHETTDIRATIVGPHKTQHPPIIGSHIESFDSSAQLLKPAEAMRLASTAHRAEAWKRERQRQAEQSATAHRSIA